MSKDSDYLNRAKEIEIIPKKEDIIADLPSNDKLLRTARIPGRAIPITLDDLIVRSPEAFNEERCNGMLEDIEECLGDAYDDEIAQALTLSITPLPSNLLEGLKELNLPEWAYIAGKLPQPLVTAITAYNANPAKYMKERQIEIAYFQRNHPEVRLKTKW